MRVSARACGSRRHLFERSSGTVATLGVAMAGAIGENSCARRVISQRKRANEMEVTEAHCTIVPSVCEWEEERYERDPGEGSQRRQVHEYSLRRINRRWRARHSQTVLGACMSAH